MVEQRACLGQVDGRLVRVESASRTRGIAGRKGDLKRSYLIVLRYGREIADRKGVPGAAIEKTTTSLRGNAAHLLEEKGNACLTAPVPDIAHPVQVDRTVTLAGLAADNYPVDACQVQGRQRPEQWLQAQEADRGRCRSQVVCPARVLVQLDRRADPDVGQGLVQAQALGDLGEHAGQARGALGEDLVGMPGRLRHDHPD